jgi:hypothetical protein
MKFRSLAILLLILPVVSICQKITYSKPENDDVRTAEFEIIGKVSGNYLVYKNTRNRYAISVYDNDMKLKDRSNLDFMPERTLNAEFIAYPDFSYIIYQYQKRNVLYCMGVKIDGNGKKISEPTILDTTHISIFADNKIYSMVNSEDKQNIMIYKIQKRYDKFNFSTLLFNADLQHKKTSKIQVPYDERKDIYSDFFVDNEGTFVFAKSIKSGNRELISKLVLVTKDALSDNFKETELPLNKKYLDEVTIKIDNINKRFLLNSFYYNEKRGFIEGLYSAVWDKQVNKLFSQNIIEFSDSLKRESKRDGALRLAMQDFFIKNVILKKDGGFILAAEDFSTQSRSNQWNRMDYLYSPYLSSYDYYLYSRSPFWYYRERNSGFNSQTRYYYNNIVILNVDKEGKLVWTNVIRKEQFDDGSDNFLSYQIMNAGAEIHFLFNELERRNQLIADQSIDASGSLKRNPTLKSLDKGYEFMPKFAKQVSAKQMIVPCIYRNYICFAKVDY